MGESGRARVESDFTWPIVAKKTEAAYRSSIERA
jgi:hypothetical protein